MTSYCVDSACDGKVKAEVISIFSLKNEVFTISPSTRASSSIGKVRLKVSKLYFKVGRLQGCLFGLQQKGIADLEVVDCVFSIKEKGTVVLFQADNWPDTNFEAVSIHNVTFVNKQKSTSSHQSTSFSRQRRMSLSNNAKSRKETLIKALLKNTEYLREMNCSTAFYEQLRYPNFEKSTITNVSITGSFFKNFNLIWTGSKGLLNVEMHQNTFIESILDILCSMDCSLKIDSHFHYSSPISL